MRAKTAQIECYPKLPCDEDAELAELAVLIGNDDISEEKLE